MWIIEQQYWLFLPEQQYWLFLPVLRNEEMAARTVGVHLHQLVHCCPVLPVMNEKLCFSAALPLRHAPEINAKLFT